MSYKGLPLTVLLILILPFCVGLARVTVWSGEFGAIRDFLEEVSVELGSKCPGIDTGKGPEEQGMWGGREAGPLWRFKTQGTRGASAAAATASQASVC